MKNKENKFKIVKVHGMTCVSCESLLEDELKNIEGVKLVKASHKNKTVELHFEDIEPNESQVNSTIKELGYEIGENLERKFFGKNRATPKQWFYSLLVVVLIILAYKLLIRFDVMGLVVFDTTNVSLGIAFLIGIVASLSSCLAVVGGVVVSFASKYQTKGNFYHKNVKPHLHFHAGRMICFFVLGGILGIVGSWFDMSSAFNGWLTAFVAVVMFLLGLNILGFLPSPSAYGIRLPKKSMKYWNKLKSSEHKSAPFLLGAFTFFLPCGFTQSMQLFAITTGSFWLGGLSLFLFALGTAPVLIGVGIAASRFKNKKMIIFQKVMGFVVLIFAFYTLLTGLTIAGINLDLGWGKDYGATITNANIQEVVMTVDYSGYSPNVFTIKKGIPVKWTINVKQMTGCTNEIIVPDLGIKKKLQYGENIIQFTPTKVGNLSFSCWMGMVRGKFIVTNGGNQSTANSIAPAAYQDSGLNTTCGASTGGGCGCGG
ncbi:sulfite exporter TauE/SafE family protein [Candidatus Kuenenbacteria bacterium]|nr:sulfite exporter TauE/SafE family protein [Candidatus Kuenenbacteria bacterium]